MCGLVAVFESSSCLSERRVLNALELLNHRGPDEQDVLFLDNKRSVLAHTRLSIIGLDNGKQPISSQDNRYHIVVNGEFYGYEEIRSDLINKEYNFSTTSDSEIALHLYREHGTRALKYLRGEFSFVIHDENNHLIFAARDRFGIKPLYYSVQDGGVYLASEIKAIFELGVPAVWDDEAYYQRINQVPLCDRTMFKNIHQVPPGHYLIATKNNIKIIPYWDFDYPRQDVLMNTNMSEQEYVEGFKEKLDEAIKLRLKADVEVGCYLSGGLDSCAVLGLAQQHSSIPIQAFTISFSDEQYDEEKLAREMAARSGSQFNSVSVTQQDIASSFHDAIFHSETLFSNAHGVSKYILSKAVHNAGIRVVFTGEGADEILAGYPSFRIDACCNATNMDALLEKNQVSLGILLPDKQTIPPEGVNNILGFVPTWMLAAASGAKKIDSLLHKDFKSVIGFRNPFQYFLSQVDMRQLEGRDLLNQSLYLWSKVMLPEFSLNFLGDRMEMAHSVEGRVPFLDHRLVEFMRTVPVGLKIKNGVEKYLLREAVKDVVPPAIYNRQKHPFLAPPVGQNKIDPMNELVRDTLTLSRLSSIPFFEGKKVLGMLNKFTKMPRHEQIAFDPIITLILSTCIIQEKFKVGSDFINQSTPKRSLSDISSM